MRFLRNLFGPKTVTVKWQEHAHKWETVHATSFGCDPVILQRCDCGEERALRLFAFDKPAKMNVDYYRARWLPKPNAEAKP